MEQAIVTDLDLDGGLRRATLTGALPAVLRGLADRGVRPVAVDLLPSGSVAVVVTAADAVALPHPSEPVVRVGLRGAGLRGDPVVVATFCEVLARTCPAPASVAAESGRVGAVVPEDSAERVVAGLCEAFELRRTAAVPV